MPQKPQTLEAKIVAKSRLFTVEQVQLRFSNGVERTYERLVNKGQGYGAVMVVAMQDARTALLIEEYCGGTDDYQLSLPKGLVEPGEDVLEAANVPPQYRKWDGSTVLEMTQAEKDAVDAAVEQANEDAAVAEYDNDAKLKALALTVLQLVNASTGNSYTIEQFKTFLRSNYNG